MKNQLLLPRICRTIGIILLPLSAWLLIADLKFPFLNTGLKVGSGMGSYDNNYNLTTDVAITGLIVSLIMIAFSKLKREDEYLVLIRLRSLQLAVYINYAAFLVATFAVNGLNYLGILMYNVVTILVAFILVFNYQLYIKPRFTKTEPV
jgi:hypothetical protein